MILNEKRHDEISSECTMAGDGINVKSLYISLGNMILTTETNDAVTDDSIDNTEDELNELQILKMMSTPCYIIACYMTALETSKVLEDFDSSYVCTCESDGESTDFHYCPGNKNFKPSVNCTSHIECSDPIYQCFYLVKSCSQFAQSSPELRKECNDISDGAKKLSVDLLDQCSNTIGVQTLLSENSGLVAVIGRGCLRREPRVINMRVPRLVTAAEMHQKVFVGHMCCQQILRKEWYGGKPLTGDARRLVEDARDLGVHLNEEVALLDEAVVAALDGLLHPQVELLADDRVQDIDYVLAGEPVHIELVFGEILQGRPAIPFSPELHHLFDAEALVVGDVEVLGLLRRDAQGLPVDQVPQVPDRSLFVGRQVALDLGRQEVEHLQKGW